MSMKTRRLTLMLVLLSMWLGAGAVSYSYRYWFDRDDNNSITGTMTSNKLHLNVDVSALESTVHTFNIQVQDANGNWTSPRIAYFAKLSPSTLRGYYWFDNDSLLSNETPVTNGILEIDVSNLTEGVHSLHYAAMSSDGSMSGVSTRWFVRAPLPAEARSMRCAWSFDGGATQIDTCTVVDGKAIHLDLDVSGLSYGRHRVDIVMLDENGNATSDVMSYFLVVEPDPCDVNRDGDVTSADITAIYNFLLNGDMTYYDTSDVTGDGDITAADITAIYNRLLGNE